MAVAYRASGSADSGASTTTSVSMSMPTGAVVADQAIVVVASSTASEPPGLPVGWTSLHSASNSDMSTLVAWKRLKPADLSATVISETVGNAVLTMGIIVFSGGDTPLLTAGTFVSAGSGVSDAAGPSVTPAVANSMLLGIGSIKWNVTPFTRTISPSAGWTERVEDQAPRSSGSNSAAYMATKLLVGGSGVLQTGLTLTASSPQFKCYPDTVVIAPGGPTGSAGDPQIDIEPYSTVTLTGTGTGTWSQTAGTSVTLGGSGNIRTFKAPGSLAGETLTFSFGGDTCDITTLPVTERMVRAGAEVPLEIQQVSS